MIPPPDLSRPNLRPNLRLVSVSEGVRAALAVGLLVGLRDYVDYPPLVEAALGALLTCLCDPGGPIRARVPVLLAFGALGAAIASGFGLLRGLGLPVVVPIAAMGIMCLSLGRLWGQGGMQLGNLLTVVLVLSLDRPESAQAGLALAAAFWAGSLWAALLTLLIWRIHPYRPARRAVAEAYHELALLVADLQGLLAADEHDPDAWDRHARRHRRAAREAIEAARALLTSAVQQRGGPNPRARQSLIRLESADQLLGALIALSDVLERTDPAARQAAPRMLHLVRAALLAVREDSLEDNPAPRPDRVALLLRVAAGVEHAPGSLAPLAQAIAERLRGAVRVTLADPDTLPPTAAEGWLQALRGGLSWQSAAFRHALRAAVVSVPALAVTLGVGDVYAHWLTITLVLTMQPFFATTWQRAVERIGGTVLGGLVAAGIGLLVHSPLAMAGLLAPLLVLAFAVKPTSFGLFMVCLTPCVVLLTELGHTGDSEWHVAGMRALYTLLGGGLAVLGALLLWPSWEPDRLAGEMRAALLAHAAWLDAMAAAGTRTGVAAARRTAGLASNNLEASLARALQEPRRNRLVDTALVVDAALRRLAGSLAALQLAPADLGEAQHPWQGWAADSLRAAATDDASPPRRPPDAPTETLQRLADRVDLVTGAMRRP